MPLLAETQRRTLETDADGPQLKKDFLAALVGGQRLRAQLLASADKPAKPAPLKTFSALSGSATQPTISESQRQTLETEAYKRNPLGHRLRKLLGV